MCRFYKEGYVTMAETMLEFKDVSFSYDTTANVQNLNVKVEKGDFIAIIGSNGAGKSTFSKLCNGLLTPTTGDVFVLNKNTRREKVSSLAKHIGFLFQNPDRQICCNTVKEEIAFSLRNNGIPEDEVDEFVALHSAYKLLGGNHNGDAKFNYCMEHLQIIPVEVKLKYD